MKNIFRKTILLTFVLTITIFMDSCNRTSCGDIHSGVFLYLKDPITVNDPLRDVTIEVDALFFEGEKYQEYQNNINSFIEDGSIVWQSGIYCIIGKIPNEYKIYQPQKVFISFRNDNLYGYGYSTHFHIINCINYDK